MAAYCGTIEQLMEYKMIKFLNRLSINVVW